MQANPIDEPVALGALRRAVRRFKRGLRFRRSRWAARHLSAELESAVELHFPGDAHR